MKQFNSMLKANGLKMVVYVKGKKVSKKKAIEMLGESRAEVRFTDALQGYLQDPFEEQSWMDGMVITFHN